MCINSMVLQICNLLFQDGITPIMYAMTACQPGVVDLLKNKYGQQEPFPEAVSTLFMPHNS